MNHLSGNGRFTTFFEQESRHVHRHAVGHKMIEDHPALTLRNTRIHFVQPLKERIVREVGYGLALEGASAAALVKHMSAQPQ